jgi:hypothetical protein
LKAQSGRAESGVLLLGDGLLPDVWKTAALMAIALGVCGCTQTTAIQQVLDPKAAPAATASLDVRADARTTGAIAVQKAGDSIFLVPKADESDEKPPAVPN